MFLSQDELKHVYVYTWDWYIIQDVDDVISEP